MTTHESTAQFWQLTSQTLKNCGNGFRINKSRDEFRDSFIYRHRKCIMSANRSFHTSHHCLFSDTEIQCIVIQPGITNIRFRIDKLKNGNHILLLAHVVTVIYIAGAMDQLHFDVTECCPPSQRFENWQDIQMVNRIMSIQCKKEQKLFCVCDQNMCHLLYFLG